MGLFGLGIKQGDTVTIKATKQTGIILDISYDKVFVETTNRRSGEPYQTWLDQSAVRKATGGNYHA